MLPTDGWLPIVNDDDRFKPVPAESPIPVTGVYRDYSVLDPAGAVQPVAVTNRAQGDGNTSQGGTGYDVNGNAALLLTLLLGSIYGVVLVDRLTIEAIADFIAGTIRPDSEWAECEDMTKPDSAWSGCDPAPDNDWSASS